MGGVREENAEEEEGYRKEEGKKDEKTPRQRILINFGLHARTS